MTAGSGPMHGGGGLRVIRDPGKAGPLVDWGPIPARDAVQTTVSSTRGLLLHKGEGGSPEAGIWECTPGLWTCRVTRDEFCHFLTGRCVYTHDSGERTEIRGGDAAFFPAGWNGRCEVIETVRKVYMIR